MALAQDEMDEELPENRERRRLNGSNELRLLGLYCESEGGEGAIEIRPSYTW